MTVTGTYSPNSEDIIHSVEVDLVGRQMISEPIHVVQYDKQLPVVEVTLWKSGQPYTVPANSEVNIRYEKPDSKIVYNNVLGLNSTRHIVYFQVSEQMTAAYGKADAVIEIRTSTGKIAATAIMSIEIDRNPVQEGAIESSDELLSLESYVSDAAASAQKAKDSETKAKTSETNAKTSETNAKASETNAKTSETNAKTSETNAKDSELSSATSAQRAKESEDAAKVSETNAAQSEENAKDSEDSAKLSELKASEYAQNAKNSEDAAKVSETNAANSEKNAKDSEDAAKASEEAADLYADNAKASEDAAKVSQILAKASETEAKKSEDATLSFRNEAQTAETNAKDWSDRAKSYAVGTNDEYRPGDSTDNALYYYEQSKSLVQGYEGIIPKGTITFEELSDPENQVPKYMFNISNAFTSDERFNDGGGKEYGPGMNVFYTIDEKWDVMAASTVIGVKGEAESVFHQGNVVITRKGLGIENATEEKAGLVKPDGETIKVDEDGTLHAEIPEATIDYNELENQPSINEVTLEGDKSSRDLGIPTVVEMTSAEYAALSDEEKAREDVIYFIPDGDSADGTFDNIGDFKVTFDSADDEVEPEAPVENVPLLKTGKLKQVLNHISMTAKNVRYLFKMLGTTDISLIGDGTVTGAIEKLNKKSMKSLSLTGFASGEGTTDENGEMSFSTIPLYGYCTRDSLTNDNTHVWYKVLEGSVPQLYTDYNIILHVGYGMSALSKEMYGILHLHVRTDGASMTSMDLIWEYTSFKVDIEAFKLGSYIDDYHHIGLFVKNQTRWNGINLTVISAYNIQGIHSDHWFNMLKPGFNDGLPSIPEEYTKVSTSSVGSLQNPVPWATPDNIGAMKIPQSMPNGSNLNNYMTPGFYWAGGGNNILNKPSGFYTIQAFGLVIIRTAGGWIRQLFFPNDSSKIYERYCNGIESETQIWSDWNEIVTKVLLDNRIPESLNNAISHHNQYRGKNLGSSYTAAQKAAVANGTFNDLYLGDFWIINSVAWRIVDINYWLRTGNTECTTNHLVIMPESPLYRTSMNDSNTTAGGYLGSKMYKENLEEAKNIIASAFGGDMVLTKSEYLVDGVTNGLSSGGTWVRTAVDIPNEFMIYGSCICAPTGNGSVTATRNTIDTRQLSLMQMYSYFCNASRQDYWLRDVVSGTDFAYFGGYGNATFDKASIDHGVRPVFGLKGA